MKRTSTVIESDTLPQSLKELREWKNGTAVPQDDLWVDGHFLDLLMKELDGLRARIDALEQSRG